MMVTGGKKLASQFKKMPVTVRKNLVKSVGRNTEQVARTAKGLVPVASGELKGGIFTQYDDGGLTGSVEAAQPNGPDQRKANAVEFGRTKGNRGTTVERPYIRLAQKLQGKKFRNSMKAAIRRGMKEATNG